MRFMKNAALLFVLALSLTVSTGLALAAPTPTSVPSDASVSFVFYQNFGRVQVSAVPGSMYQVYAPSPSGLPMVLTSGDVGPSGGGQSKFALTPGLIVATITVTVTPPGMPPINFIYNSDLDRWIID